MDNEVYKKCVNHIAQLTEQIQIISKEKSFTEQRVAKLLEEKGNIIKAFQGEQNTVLRDKERLENRLTQALDENNKLKGIISHFENQTELLQFEIDEISQQLQSKTTDLERERAVVTDLQLKYITAHFMSNKMLINGHIDQCNISLKVFDIVNAFLSRNFNITLFPESTEWFKTLEELKMLLDSQQAEFSRMYGYISGAKGNIDINEINLNGPQIPARPVCSLEESVHRAFCTMHTHMMKNQIHNTPPPLLPTPMLFSSMNPPRYPPWSMNSMNPRYPYPRNHMPYAQPHQVYPQSRMNFNFSESTTSINNETKKLSSSNFKSEIVAVSEKQEKNEKISLREDSDCSNDLSLSEVLLEEKDKLSETSSHKGSTTSLLMKSENVPVSTQNEVLMKKPKCGFDRVKEKLSSELVGIPEYDLIKCILDFRKMHNNSLNGMKSSEIVKNVKNIILKRQRQHIHDYTDKHPTNYKEEYSRTTENAGIEKPVEGNDFFHPFAFERLSILRNRNNSVSSTSSAGSAPVKNEIQTAKKTCMKPAWLAIKTNDNNWKKESQEPDCSICMEPFDNASLKKTLYTLKCQHSFHTECIRDWLKKSQSCPNCRVYATHDEDFPPLPL